MSKLIKKINGNYALSDFIQYPNAVKQNPKKYDNIESFISPITNDFIKITPERLILRAEYTDQRFRFNKKDEKTIIGAWEATNLSLITAIKFATMLDAIYHQLTYKEQGGNPNSTSNHDEYHRTNSIHDKYYVPELIFYK